MNESNYDPKTKDNIFNNDTTFSQKRFGELVNQVNTLKNSISNTENNEQNNSNAEYQLSTKSDEYDAPYIVLSKTDGTSESVVAFDSSVQNNIGNTYYQGLQISAEEYGYPGEPSIFGININLSYDFINLINSMYNDIQTLKSKVQ